MIGQITPLVQVAGRRAWLVATVGHLAGAVVSASVLGFVLGTVGLALGFDSRSPAIGVLIGAILLMSAVRDAGLVRSPLPSLERQTPRWFSDAFGPIWSALAWGVDLGQGWTTHILFTGYYALLAWSVLGGHPLQAAIICAAYGLGRALPVVLAGMLAPRKDFSSLLVSRARQQGLLQQVNAAALAVAGMLMLMSS